jgi:uncharacterized protein YciI
MRIRIPAVVVLILLLSSLSFAQENKLVQFRMAILKKGPKWDTTKEQYRNTILEQHVGNAISLLDGGKAVVAGPFTTGPFGSSNTDLAGIFILRAASAEEAKSWVDADPAVKAGLMTAEMHPWWSEDIFKKAATPPLKMETVYLGFLKRGPNRKEGDGKNPEVQELQKAHIANINRLAETRKLVMAGPFGGSGDLRGIFVFRVGSLKEAQDLAASDPMIKIDRLRLELHPWNVPAGVIP